MRVDLNVARPRRFADNRIGAKGVKLIAEALKTNRSITSLEYGLWLRRNVLWGGVLTLACGNATVCPTTISRWRACNSWPTASHAAIIPCSTSCTRCVRRVPRCR
jgi:hypothetical protein